MLSGRDLLEWRYRPASLFCSVPLSKPFETDLKSLRLDHFLPSLLIWNPEGPSQLTVVLSFADIILCDWGSLYKFHWPLRLGPDLNCNGISWAGRRTPSRVAVLVKLGIIESVSSSYEPRSRCSWTLCTLLMADSDLSFAVRNPAGAYPMSSYTRAWALPSSTVPGDRMTRRVCSSGAPAFKSSTQQEAPLQAAAPAAQLQAAAPAAPTWAATAALGRNGSVVWLASRAGRWETDSANRLRRGFCIHN